MSDPSPADRLRLARDPLVIWPLLGVFTYAGYNLARTLDVLPFYSWRLLFLPGLFWGLLAPVLTLVAVSWRPGTLRPVPLIALHTAAFAACSVLETLVINPDPLAALLPGNRLARDLLSRSVVYVTIICTIWTHLLLRDIDEAGAFELRSASAASSSLVNRLALPARYFASLLRGIASDLRSDAARAEQSTLQTAALLRMQLDAAARGDWALADEVALLDRYVDMQRSRGVRFRLLIDVSDAASAARVWPGSLAVEISAFLSDRGRHDREVLLTVDRDAGDRLRATVEIPATNEQRSFTIDPAPANVALPDPRLAGFASHLARHWMFNVALAVAIFASVTTFLGVALRYAFDGFTVRAVLMEAMRTSARIAVVIPVVFRLNAARAVHPVRFFAITFGTAVAAEWWYQVCSGFLTGNSAAAVFAYSAAITLSSLSPAYLSVAPVAVAVYMVRVGRVAAMRNEHAVALLRRLRESQGRFLLWQTNPHLLFNALNSAASLMRSDPRAAEHFLSLLTSFYDDINVIENDTHGLRAEIGMLARYFAIERIRFGDRVVFTVDADPRLDHAEVPALLLQPIVENAMKHGAVSGDRLTIALAVTSAADRIRIRVANADSCRGDISEGFGLRLTRERLRTLYGEAASLHIHRDGRTFETAIELPLIAH